MFANKTNIISRASHIIPDLGTWNAEEFFICSFKWWQSYYWSQTVEFRRTEESICWKAQSSKYKGHVLKYKSSSSIYYVRFRTSRFSRVKRNWYEIRYWMRFISLSILQYYIGNLKFIFCIKISQPSNFGQSGLATNYVCCNFRRRWEIVLPFSTLYQNKQSYSIR